MKKTMRFLLAAVAVVFGMTSCDEFKSFMDNPVQSYLEVRQTELYVQEGKSVMLYVHTISDAAITYTVGDEKIAKVEKVDNLDAKVTGVKPGETEVTVKLAATDAYQGGEVKVKIIVAPAVTLADAVKDGAKLQIGCKFNGEDCLLAYEFDADKKKFNLLYEDCDVPKAFVDYSVNINYDEEKGKIAFTVNYEGDDTTMPKVPFELNLYTAGSFDRIFRVPVEMKSVVVNNYDVLPYTQESVTPIQSLQPVQLSEEMSTGTKGSFAVISISPQNATNQVIRYSSSNTAVMTIDANGNFEAVGEGKATLKAEATDGSGMFVEQEVTVKALDPAKAYLMWDSKQKKLVAAEIPTTATVVESSNGVDWLEGTYVVEGKVKINGTIKLYGEVKLIIKDDAQLTVNGYINGNSQNLRIFGQAKKSGELVVSSNDDAIKKLSTLEVHSAKVTATSSGGYCGGFYKIGTFNVYDGLVDAKGTASTGYGIGLNAGVFMNIYGGEVKAEGKGGDDVYSNGILCESGTNPTVTVYGGKLWSGSANQKAFGYVNLQKGEGFTGKIETSDNGSSWSVYTEATTPTSKYVKVGY